MATINGFERGNGTTDKYNYEALENKPTIPAVDATLATTGAAADAKKTGDEIADLKSAISVMEPTATASDVGKALIAKTVSGGKVTSYEFGEAGGGIDPSEVADAVADWLDEHPEATTTVEDGSLTEEKLTVSTLAGLKNNHVTPEMFGAVGDGITDDSAAVQDACDAGYDIYFESNKTYYIPTTVTINHDIHLYGGENTIIKTETVNGSLNDVFVVNGTLKKTTTLTTDYTSEGNTDNSGNMFTLADMSGISAGDIMVVQATDQYYSYVRSYYYLGMTLLIGDKDNSHIYTTESMPWDMILTNNVSVKIYGAPMAIIENLHFIGDRESIGHYKYFITLDACKSSIIRNCNLSEMDNGIRINHCVNTLIDNLLLSDGKNDNTISGDGYGIGVLASTFTIIQRITAIAAQTPITTGGDVCVVNLYVRDCNLASQCRHNGIGMHENTYNIVVENCILGGLNILGVGTVNECRFINNRRLGSQTGGITFCGSHDPKYAILKVTNCTFEGNSMIYVYSPSPQNPIQAFDCVVGLIEVTDCDGGYIAFEGTISQTILSNRIKELKLTRWANCGEFYRPNSSNDIIEKMIVSDCTFTAINWANDHNPSHGVLLNNIYDLVFKSSIPMGCKISVDKPSMGEKYTLPENVSIQLSATNSTTARYIVCGNNLASNNADDYLVGSVGGSSGGTLSKSTASGATVTNDSSGNIVFTQGNYTSNLCMYPVGMFYCNEKATIKMSATIKNTGSTSAATFKPMIAIVNCATGKLVDRYIGTAVEATSAGANISYQHSISENQIAMCYYYCSSAIANSETTFENLIAYLENRFATLNTNNLQPYEAKRLTGDGTILSLAGVNNIMSSEDNFHITFTADYCETPVGMLSSAEGVSF